MCTPTHPSTSYTNTDCKKDNTMKKVDAVSWKTHLLFNSKTSIRTGTVLIQTSYLLILYKYCFHPMNGNALLDFYPNFREAPVEGQQVIT